MDTTEPGTFQEAKEAWTRAYFVRLHSETSGNVSEMARRAGMERSHVRTYLRRFDLAPRGRSNSSTVAA